MKSKQENTIRLVIWIFSKGFPCFRLYMPQRPKYFPSYINKGLTFDNVLDLITKITRKKKKKLISEFRDFARDYPVSGRNYLKDRFFKTKPYH